MARTVGRQESAGLFALLVERVEHSGKSLSFIGIRIDFIQPLHHLYVLRANLLQEAVSLGAESFERLVVPFLLGTNDRRDGGVTTLPGSPLPPTNEKTIAACVAEHVTSQHSTAV